MRNTRLRIISALLFCQALTSVWGTASILTRFGVEWSLCLILLASLGQLVFAATVGLGGESSSVESRQFLAWTWSASMFIWTLPALFGLLQYLPLLGTLMGLLNCLGLISAVAALAYTVSMISSFLRDEGQQILLGARASQQMFSIMLLAGSIASLVLLTDDLFGIKVSITLSGAFFYGFAGWRTWNCALVLISLAILVSRKLQWLATWALSLLFVVLPFLAAPAFHEWASSMGMEIDVQNILFLVPALVIAFSLSLGHEVRTLHKSGS